MSSVQPLELLDISIEVLVCIFDHMPFYTLLDLSYTCKILREIIVKQPRFQKNLNQLDIIYKSKIMDCEDDAFVCEFPEQVLEKGFDINITPPIKNRFDQIHRIDFDVLDFNRIKYLNMYPSLKELNIRYYSELTDIPNLVNHKSLNKLSIQGCIRLNILDLAKLKSLEFLDLDCCTGLTEISCLTQLEFLKNLDLRCCSGLTDFSWLANLESLKRLCLQGCTGLTDISCLENLESLERLLLEGCTGITDILCLSNLKSLERLELDGCTGVTDFSCLANLESLQYLILACCSGLTDISYLANLEFLELLNLEDCTQLTDISYLTSIESLKKLYLQGCSGLTDFACLTNIESLKDLGIRDCTGLNNSDIQKLISELPYCHINY